MADFVKVFNPKTNTYSSVNSKYIDSAKESGLTTTLPSQNQISSISDSAKEGVQKYTTSSGGVTETKPSTTTAVKPTVTAPSASNAVSSSSDYKIISPDGKGLATGEASTANDVALANGTLNIDDERARTNKVIADREAAGADTSAQQAYLAKLDALQTGSSTGIDSTDLYLEAIRKRAASGTPGESDVPVATTVDEATSAKNSIIELIRANQTAQQDALTAAEEARFKAESANLEKAYNQAVADEEKLKVTANEQYQADVDQINQDRYDTRQGTAVSSEQRGIGNSAQFQALERGTLSRASRLKIEQASERDSLLNSITERINNLGLSKDLDLTAAESTKDYNIATGNAAIAGQAFSQELGELQTQDERAFKVDEREAAQDYNTSEREASQDYSTESREDTQAFNAEQGELQRMFTSDENELNRIQQTNERIASQGFQLSKIKSANDRADALAEKTEADLFASYGLGVGEYERLREMVGQEELDARRAELEMDNELTLEYQESINELENGTGPLANLGEEGKVRYNNYIANAHDLVTNPAYDLSQREAEFHSVMNSAMNDAYIQGEAAEELSYRLSSIRSQLDRYGKGKEALEGVPGYEDGVFVGGDTAGGSSDGVSINKNAGGTISIDSGIDKNMLLEQIIQQAGIFSGLR